MQTTELLHTKLQRPRLPRHHVPRPRLTERLDQALHVPLTLVAAAAGYGKTTLVNSWLESLEAEPDAMARRPSAWISLDEDDSDLGTFLRYFICSLRTMFPDACAETASLLHAMRSPPFNVLYHSLINEVSELPKDFVIVLDDFHRVRGSAVLDLFASLEHHWPRSMHIVLIARHVPALPLASLRAKGLVTEIRARDLQFKPDEAAAYLELMLKTPLSRQAVDLLERHTEGWIAGLQLAGLSLQDAEDPEAVLADLSGLDTEFTDYLAHDVLSRQPAAILSFLYQTAVMERFSVALCEEVVTVSDSRWSTRKCVDWLVEHNLFVSSLGSRGEWYRYHHIFRSVLLERAEPELGPEGTSELHRKTAIWFAQNGFVEDSIRYGLEANDLQLATRFISEGLRDVLNHEEWPTLQRWLALFPEEFIRDNAVLQIVRGFQLVFSWQLGAMARTVSHAASLLTRGESDVALSQDEWRKIHACFAAQSAVVAYFNNQFAVSESHSREALSIVPEGWSFVRSGAMLFLRLSMQARGQGEAVVRQTIQEYENQASRDSYYALRLLQALCFVSYAEARNLNSLVQTATKLVDGSNRDRLSIQLGWGHFFVGIARYQMNDLDASRLSFANLFDLKYTANLGALRDGVGRLALIHQMAGEQAEAWEILEFLSRLDLEQTGYETDGTRALRAQLQLMRGELRMALQWANSFTSPIQDVPWLWQYPPHLVKAQILVNLGTPVSVRSALDILETFSWQAERSHNVRLQIDVLALRAVALFVLEQTGEAMEVLVTALTLAQPGGFLRPFLDLGAPMAAALSRLAVEQNAFENLMLRRLLDELANQSRTESAQDETALQSDQRAPFTAFDSSSRGVQPLVEPLTPRELEILAQLRDPVSLKEVAQRLYISYATARRHTANIYDKLGVHKRSSAVSRASALGLLPPH